MSSFFFLCIINVFIFGCAGSPLLFGVFSRCGERGLLSSRGVQRSHRGGFSCCGNLALACAGFSRCDLWTQ